MCGYLGKCWANKMVRELWFCTDFPINFNSLLCKINSVSFWIIICFIKAEILSKHHSNNCKSIGFFITLKNQHWRFCRRTSQSKVQAIFLITSCLNFRLRARLGFFLSNVRRVSGKYLSNGKLHGSVIQAFIYQGCGRNYSRYKALDFQHSTKT